MQLRKRAAADARAKEIAQAVKHQIIPAKIQAHQNRIQVRGDSSNDQTNTTDNLLQQLQVPDPTVELYDASKSTSQTPRGNLDDDISHLTNDEEGEGEDESEKEQIEELHQTLAQHTQQLQHLKQTLQQKQQAIQM